VAAIDSYGYGCKKQGAASTPPEGLNNMNVTLV